MPRHKPLADEVKFMSEVDGIVNMKRKKDIGQKGLVSAVNVELTNTKHLTRRNGFMQADTGAYSAVYGTDAQTKLYAVKSGTLYDVDRDGVQTALTSGLLDGLYSWDEDPNNNVYFASDSGSNGIITQDGIFLPLALPTPAILDVSVVDPGTWEVRPFNLGKTYTANQMQLMATYVMDDGRETAPSETVSIDVAPEVKMIRVTVPTAGRITNIYCTAPGGSTYYLVAVSSNAVITILVGNMNMTATGSEYPYTSSMIGFPDNASLLCFYDGQLYTAVNDPQRGVGTVYRSLPLQYHLFDPNTVGGFTDVSSVPLLLLEHGEGVIIGTSTNIYNWAKDGTLDEIANFGVPPGICGGYHHFNKKCYFWTHRGVARAMPFELVTDGVFSGDPGVVSHAALLYERGYAKLVASTISGAPNWNPFVERS